MYRTFRAVRFLFVGPFILLICLVVNLMTYHGHLWVKWAALGIGIAWLFSLMRVLRLLVMLGGLAALIAYMRKR
jgi:hypothetical protein